MTDRDSAKFARLFALLSETFNKPVSDPLAEIYFRTLKNFTIEQVESAVEQAIASRKFFPKPAELRELLEGSPDDQSMQAWAMFLEAAASGGHASIQFSDRAMAVAMEAVFGGWTQACGMLSASCSDEMVAHYQKAFLKQYAAARTTKQYVPLYRPGLSEVSMREQGGTWAPRIPTLQQPVLFVGPDKVHTLQLRFDVARGQLTDADRRLLDGGWEAVQMMAAQESRKLRRATERNALPLAEEMATAEEVEELKAQIAALQPTTRS